MDEAADGLLGLFYVVFENGYGLLFSDGAGERLGPGDPVPVADGWVSGQVEVLPAAKTL